MGGQVAARRAMLRAALTGLAMGLAWGVAARVFMRLVTDKPEFSWVGTMFILGLAALHGTCVAIAAEAHRQGRRQWWYVAVLPGMLIFGSQGLLFLPAFIIGGVAIARCHRVGWPIAAVAAVAPAVLIWWEGRLDEQTMLAAPFAQQFWMLVGFPALGLWMAWYASELWRPRAERVSTLAADSAQSGSPDLARSSRRSDSSLEAPAGPA